MASLNSDKFTANKTIKQLFSKKMKQQSISKRFELVTDGKNGMFRLSARGLGMKGHPRRRGLQGVDGIWDNEK